jgi:hypothetical protein
MCAYEGLYILDTSISEVVCMCVHACMYAMRAHSTHAERILTYKKQTDAFKHIILDFLLGCSDSEQSSITT